MKHTTQKKYRIDPNRCDYCGRFISYSDLDTGKAIIHMLYPDSAYTVETYESYHLACEEKSKAKYAALNTKM